MNRWDGIAAIGGGDIGIEQESNASDIHSESKLQIPSFLVDN